jgi:Tfp pilus assembly protein PilN
MLRGNLSTRPFYNERAIRSMLAVLALAAIGLTLFNAVEIFRLERAGRDARQTVAQNAAQAQETRVKAQAIRQGINQAQLEAVRISARDANALIDRRTFSWTALLNYFQATLPPDVRIAGVRPQIDDDGLMLVAISLFARRIDDLSEFEDALENTGAFKNVLSRTIGTQEDGSTRAELQGYYSGPAAPAGSAASAPARASDANGHPTTQSPRRGGPGGGAR